MVDFQNLVQQPGDVGDVAVLGGTNGGGIGRNIIFRVCLVHGFESPPDFGFHFDFFGFIFSRRIKYRLFRAVMACVAFLCFRNINTAVKFRLI